MDENVESEHISKPHEFQSLSGACEELLHCEMKTLGIMSFSIGSISEALTLCL